MGTKRTPAAPVAPVTPLDHAGLLAAVKRFVDGFVVADKRDQMTKRLSAADRRDDTLATLARWLGGLTTPLAGADLSPAGLRARFGDLVGVLVDRAGARRTTIGNALALARGARGVFVGDTGRIALLLVDDAAPLLCQR